MLVVKVRTVANSQHLEAIQCGGGALLCAIEYTYRWFKICDVGNLDPIMTTSPVPIGKGFTLYDDFVPTLCMFYYAKKSCNTALNGFEMLRISDGAHFDYKQEGSYCHAKGLKTKAEQCRRP